jgi:hypothetical protein
VAEYVFGYGSLVAQGGWACALRGHRRGWGVAMDNARTIPGYKYYVDADTGERPEVFVAFLDVQPADESDGANGLVFPVTAKEMAVLDHRERNYDRVDVTDLIDPPPGGGRVWTYAGSAEGRERRERGLAAGTLVVSAEYARSVVEPPEPPCPVTELRRIDVPLA